MATTALGMGFATMESWLPRRVDKLTSRQLDCLRLVAQHLSSKEIAGELGISPHTVDQRIRQALQILGVERRSQAARIVIDEAGPYQRLIHQSPYIAADPVGDQQDGAISHQIRHADRAGGTGETGLETEQGTQPRFPLVLPFATRSNPSNEMSVGQKLTWIVIIAIGATFSAGMYLAGLESLSRMIGH
ncbi:MAG: helix-turn-helix transcriptional regulator [Sphingomicrobium sp.]